MRFLYLAAFIPPSIQTSLLYPEQSYDMILPSPFVTWYKPLKLSGKSKPSLKSRVCVC